MRLVADDLREPCRHVRILPLAWFGRLVMNTKREEASVGMAEEIIAYCVKEKANKPMKDAREVTLSNGRRAMQGVCSSCGTKMMKFLPNKKAS